MISNKSRIFAVLLMVIVAGSVHAEDAKEVVIASAEELKGLKAKKIIWKKDGAKMVLIPAGSFEMGDYHDNTSIALPVHTIELDEFYMDVMEVTNAQYQVFMQQTGHRQPSYWNDNRFNQPNQPVVIDMRNSI